MYFPTKQLGLKEEFSGIQLDQHSLRLDLNEAQRMKNDGDFLNILNFQIWKMLFTSYMRIMTENLAQPIILNILSNA